MIAAHGAAEGAAPVPTRVRRRRTVLALGSLLTLVSLASPSPGRAQDWGDEAQDDWSAPAPRADRAQSTSTGPSGRGLAARAGLGFTADPTTFLLDFELPYALERWIAIGPSIQVGLDDDRTLVMPTANVTLRIPDLPGRSLDRVQPFGFAGIGFAWIEREKRRETDDGAGFLVDAGFGVEYQVSEKVFLGTRMTFNFLPQSTQGERFIFAWQMAGLRIAF